jgi:prevent-host-death family protein
MCYAKAMVSIGIRELRQHASRYVRMAKAGRRVAVTERGALVAYLVPAEEPASLLARLEAAGEYVPPVGSVLDLLPPPPVPHGRRPLSEVVQELREQERE